MTRKRYLEQAFKRKSDFLPTLEGLRPAHRLSAFMQLQSCNKRLAKPNPLSICKKYLNWIFRGPLLQSDLGYGPSKETSLLLTNH